MTIYVNGIKESEGGTLAEDTVDNGVNSTVKANATNTTGGRLVRNLDADEEIILGTCTTTFDTDVMVVATGFGCCHASTTNMVYYRLYIDGTIVETLALTSPATAINQVIVGSKLCSGSTICKLVVWNSDQITDHGWTVYAQANEAKLPFGIGVGSVKL